MTEFKKVKGKEGEKAGEDVFFGLSLELSLCCHQMETSRIHFHLSPTTPLRWERAAKGLRMEKCLCSSVSKCFTAIDIYWFSPSTLSPRPPYKIRDSTLASRQGEAFFSFLETYMFQCNAYNALTLS